MKIDDAKKHSLFCKKAIFEYHFKPKQNDNFRIELFKTRRFGDAYQDFQFISRTDQTILPDSQRARGGPVMPIEKHVELVSVVCRGTNLLFPKC